MKRLRLLLPAVAVLVANGIALVGVARNRSGGPVATIELTERELRLRSMPEENTGLSLQLRWHNTADYRLDQPEDGPGWFNQSKLVEMGFDCSVAPGNPSAEAHYRNVLPREAFIAFEYEGPAWQAWLSAPARGRWADPRAAERDRLTESRLFAIDAARDPAALRNRHADPQKVLIVSGLVRLVYEKPPPVLRGAITEVHPREVYVPRNHGGFFDALHSVPSDAYFTREPEPRYRVKLAWGRLYEPWIVAVSR